MIQERYMKLPDEGLLMNVLIHKLQSRDAGILRIFLKSIYLLSAVGVGVGCFYSFMFFIFNIGGGFISSDNKPAAFGVAALAVVGTIFFTTWQTHLQFQLLYWPKYCNHCCYRYAYFASRRCG